LQSHPMTIPDLMLLTPARFKDERGCFFESFNQKQFNQMIGSEQIFVQDNQSISHRSVLRGLHYQIQPHAQGKLVRVSQGEIFDVAVDLRRQSATFGQWQGVVLSDKNSHQFWIPAGFAHGYLVMSDKAVVHYKTTDYYHPESERHIIWNDTSLKIDWPLQSNPMLSEKDMNASPFVQAEYF